MIRLQRVYEPPSDEDGMRILVERLWPRGITKERAKIDLWARDIAPSGGLRKWYGHQEARWAEFREKYTGELGGNREAVGMLRREIKGKSVTFVYAARAEGRNSAVVLKEYLENGARA